MQKELTGNGNLASWPHPQSMETMTLEMATFMADIAQNVGRATQ